MLDFVSFGKGFVLIDVECDDFYVEGVGVNDDFFVDVVEVDDVDGFVEDFVIGFVFLCVGVSGVGLEEEVFF